MWGPPIEWNQKDETPYINWWREVERNSLGLLDKDFEDVTVTFNSKGLRSPELKLPVPIYAWNKGKIEGDGELRQHLSKERLGPVPKKTVLIGIVDTGIALGHRRLRNQNGETRFISSWQQTADFACQKYLPFGRELYGGVPGATFPGQAKETSINALIQKYSVGDLFGEFDETGFNKDAGLSQPQHIGGYRDLDYAVSHGAHVLDLAAGIDPENLEKGCLNRNRIIAVNLPPQSVYGSAGNFLTPFAVLAVERILKVADTLWRVQHGEAAGGFPLVINFSFGKMAGPKDGRSTWERLIREQIKRRNRTAPTRLVMPAGNQNLSRGNARALLGPVDGDENGSKSQTKLSVPWRIKPNDQTSNFVEVWAKQQRPKNRSDQRSKDEEASIAKFKIFVTPPGSPKLEVKKLKEPGTYSELGEFARVYCYADLGQKRPHFVICTAPTLSWKANVQTAPAGLWTIEVEYLGKKKVQETTFGVQTDLSGVRSTSGAMRSYFDHQRYKTHHESGRLRDSYIDIKINPDCDEFCDDKGHCEPWDLNGPVQRKGTHNSLATWKNTRDAALLTVVGGYTLSNNTPALYSSTFDGDSKRYLGRETPTALYPSDTAPSLFGILAAGSRDGSTVALRGTSVSAAFATRHIAMAFSESFDSRRQPESIDDNWVEKQAKKKQNVNGLKRGKGMVEHPKNDRIDRFAHLKCLCKSSCVSKG